MAAKPQSIERQMAMSMVLEIGLARGHPLSPEQVADALIDIAKRNMVTAETVYGGEPMWARPWESRKDVLERFRPGYEIKRRLAERMGLT